MTSTMGTEADTTLHLMRCPELETILRSATPGALRAFAIAGGRLAVSLTRYDQPEGVAKTLHRHLDMAGLLAQGVPVEDPDIAGTRSDAVELAAQLDERQLDLLGLVQDEAERADIEAVEHPRYPAYSAAAHCASAADAVVEALREDAFQGAVQCAWILENNLRVDMPTVIALARVAVLDHGA